MFQTVASHDFPGLDLRSSPDEAGCIDILNVDPWRPGHIKTRAGTAQFYSTIVANMFTSMHPYVTSSGTSRLVVADDADNLNAISTASSVIDSGTASTNSDQSTSFVRFAAPGSEHLYIGCGKGATVMRYDGSDFTTPTYTGTTPTGRCVGVTPDDNRLCVGNVSTTYPSRVLFSDPGDPLTFGVDNYVDLAPGDGDEIQIIVAWRDLVFVFKKTKFFVFYGNSTDAVGEPVFNYRTIDSGVGAVGPWAACAGRDGVYLLSRDGIYLTAGGPPRKISGRLDPLWLNGGADSFFTPTYLSPRGLDNGAPRLVWHQEKLFAACPFGAATTNTHTLVHDPERDLWTVYDFAAYGMTSWVRGGDPYEAELFFGKSVSGNGKIHRYNSQLTDDAGSAIVSRYRTGFRDLGTDSEKKIDKTRLVGIGTLDVKWSRDFGSLGSAKSAVLGTSPAIDQAVVSCNVRRGRVFSVQYGASSGAWTLYRAQHEISGPAPPNTQTP